MGTLTKEPFILRLPDELLDRIIREACTAPLEEPYGDTWWRIDKRGHTRNVKSAAPLPIVCRRLYSIAVPYLYADIHVSCHRDRGSLPAATRLHRSMRRNPALWGLCRRMLVDFDQTDEGDERERETVQNPFLFRAMDYCTWFEGLRSLAFHGLQYLRAWDLVAVAVANCPLLEELRLVCRAPYSLDLGRVVDLLSEGQSPRLRVLQVDGISKEGGYLMEKKLREKAGLASFSVLKTSSFLQAPSVLEALVRWPHTLDEIEIEHTFSACYGYPGLYADWSLATLQPIFEIHKSTLRRISVRCLNAGGLAGFDLRDFPSLEELKLSARTTRSRRLPYTVEYPHLRNLLAPRLRVFHWDLTAEDQQCDEKLHDFAQGEEDLLREFANTALRAAVAVPLREIRITFTPDPYVYSESIGQPYPWDQMDALDAEFRGRGVRVRYNAPSLSREEFLESQAEARN
ncbi:hypothetical protein BJX65DRAFT_35451 [Aspergillus insuetus]